MKTLYRKDRFVTNYLTRWLVGGVVWGFLLLAGCSENNLEVADPKKEQAPPSALKKQPLIRSEKLLQRRANVGDECPKLVQKRIDHTAVSRQDSIMGYTCDYFIYPAVGDVLTVYVSDGRMKPFLNTPYYHDFANGSYKVIANGRHVIRLEYNALEHKPMVMDYVFVVNIVSAK